MQRIKHRRKQEEEEELLRRIEVKHELRKVERGVLNIQPLAVRLASHSSSSSKHVEGRHIM